MEDRKAAELAARNAAWEAEEAPPEEVLAWAAARHRPRIMLACSFGVEDCVLVDMLSRVAPDVEAFYLDTGLLFPETYQLRDRLAERYATRFHQILPALTVDEQADAYGPALWSREPDRCCHMRKVEPLRGVLAGLDCWITGIRRQQSRTRAASQRLEWDAKFGLAKVNPLVAWSAEQVWEYVHRHEVPYNPLHDRGYPSIGCWPCTRPVREGEDERAGRWAGLQKTECGLHSRRTVRSS